MSVFDYAPVVSDHHFHDHSSPVFFDAPSYIASSEKGIYIEEWSDRIGQMKKLIHCDTKTVSPDLKK
jgi:hypothetical protein